jgi:hypothetical protein
LAFQNDKELTTLGGSGGKLGWTQSRIIVTDFQNGWFSRLSPNHPLSGGVQLN